MYNAQRRARAAQPGLADLSDEILTVIICHLSNVRQKLVFSRVCRRFDGLMFQPKALGDVTLNLNKLLKMHWPDQTMSAVRCASPMQSM